MYTPDAKREICEMSLDGNSAHDIASIIDADWTDISDFLNSEEAFDITEEIRNG